ncbi:MAG TPA: ribonuclease HI family protein, partial [Acidobacteriaceae bacterium]|nr:ribonuclease HI family protein [Acidobacteriaceae bacterium]
RRLRYTRSMSSEQGGLFGGVNPQRGGAEWVTAYCDGGSRGNPGPAGYGVFIEGPGGEKLAELSEYLGKKTNNVAEYSGLLAALEWALQAGRRRLRVVADSELMVKQMQGRYKVASPDLRPLYEEAKRRVAQLEGFRIEHVLRGKNKNADRLANLAMDRGTGRSGGVGSGSASGGNARPGTGRPGGAGVVAERASEPFRAAKGFVKGGVVHLIEGELPEGAFVKVVLDRQ